MLSELGGKSVSWFFMNSPKVLLHVSLREQQIRQMHLQMDIVGGKNPSLLPVRMEVESFLKTKKQNWNANLVIGPLEFHSGAEFTAHNSWFRKNELPLMPASLHFLFPTSSLWLSTVATEHCHSNIVAVFNLCFSDVFICIIKVDICRWITWRLTESSAQGMSAAISIISLTDVVKSLTSNFYCRQECLS